MVGVVEVGQLPSVVGAGCIEERVERDDGGGVDVGGCGEAVGVVEIEVEGAAAG